MTFDQAHEEMCAMVREDWELYTPEIVDDIPAVLWPGMETATPPPLEVPYARISIQHTTGRQRTLGSSSGSRLFERGGYFVAQCYAPMGITNYLSTARKLGKIVLDAFEGRASPGGIWFRNCRLTEVGPVDGRYQVNAIIEFSYDEVK